MSALNDLYKKGGLGYIEEMIMKLGNYAWGEMTLLEQGELKEKAAEELAALREKVAELQARNKWWLENYDITMPCGHKNRYLATKGNGELVLDDSGNALCAICSMEEDN